MALVPTIVALLGLSFVSGASYGRSTLRRSISLGLAIATLGLPLSVAEAPTLARSLLALASMLPLLRFFDFDAEKRERTAFFRGLATLLPYDLRMLEPTRRRLDGRLLARSFAHGLLFVAGLAIVGSERASASDSSALPIRVLGGLMIAYGMLDAIGSALLVLHRLAGFDFPEIQRHPILARSLREFWAERWNHTVNRWLRRRCFAPMVARGRPAAGLAASFAVSALIHFWVAFPGAGAEFGFSMASYFLVQGLLVGLELRMPWPRQWPALGRVYAIAAVVLPSPLFTEPLLVGLGLRSFP